MTSQHFLSSIVPRKRMAGQENHDLEITALPHQSAANQEHIASAFSDCTVTVGDEDRLKKLTPMYWAQQECEAIPSCIVRPRNIEQLSKVIIYLKQCFDNAPSSSRGMKKLFAVRSGGHSPVSGTASIGGGVLLDLGQFSAVTISQDDHPSVTIGAGAQWLNVSKTLEEHGLAVCEGRDSAVGVGSLALGGGLSFFSSRFGLVCSNVIEYEVVLASGSVVKASADHNPDLWRALKGGGNNFGIVTQIMVRAFPSSKSWSGFLYLPSFQALKVLRCFHEVVNDSDKSNGVYKPFAAGPIACFSYIHQIGMQVISVNLVYTENPDDSGDQRPVRWKQSQYASLLRLWTTCKNPTLSDATDEMATPTPTRRRQVFATTTIQNDQDTLITTHSAYQNAIIDLRKAKIKGLVWTLVLQPLLPTRVGQIDTNPPSHETGDEALIIVSLAVSWDESQDDDQMQYTIRRTIEKIEAVAKANNRAYRYKYANYCAAWQNPYKSYGLDNLRFLQATSKSYDPDGFFQVACAGGFKLGMTDDHSSQI